MSEELLSLKSKLRQLSENLKNTEREMKEKPFNEWNITEMTEAMLETLHEIDDIKLFLKETELCRDYEMLCNSWRKCCDNSFTKLLFCRHENNLNDELLKKAMSAVSTLNKAVTITYEEIMKSKGQKIRVSDLYYATIHGMKMDSPGVYFAHSNEHYDAFPIRVSASITGNERFWEKSICKKKYLYTMIQQMAILSYEMLENADLNTIFGTSDIIHDYGDFIKHSADVYEEEYSDYAQFAERFSLLFYQTSDAARKNRIQALNTLKVNTDELTNYLLLIGIL